MPNTVRAIQYILPALHFLLANPPFIRENLYLRPSTIIEDSSKKGETIARDVCRRSLRSSSLETDGNFNFFPRDVSLSLRSAAAFLPSVSCNLFFRYQLKL